MTIVKYFQRIERIDQLIRLNATGTPRDLSQKLNICETVLYETIAIMKEFGAPIYYDKFKQSYCYEEDGKFDFLFNRN